MGFALAESPCFHQRPHSHVDRAAKFLPGPNGILRQVKKLVTHLHWAASCFPVYQSEFAFIAISAEYLLNAIDLPESNREGAVRFTGGTAPKPNFANASHGVPALAVQAQTSLGILSRLDWGHGKRQRELACGGQFVASFLGIKSVEQKKSSLHASRHRFRTQCRTRVIDNVLVHADGVAHGLPAKLI